MTTDAALIATWRERAKRARFMAGQIETEWPNTARALRASAQAAEICANELEQRGRGPAAPAAAASPRRPRRPWWEPVAAGV